MSFASLLNRTLAIERPFQTLDMLDEPKYDDYNQPVREFVSITEEVRGRISAGPSREVPSTTGAGPVIADHTIFLKASVDVTTQDRIHDTVDGRAFEVLGRKLRAGQSAAHHWELDAREITSADTAIEEPGS